MAVESLENLREKLENHQGEAVLVAVRNLTSDGPCRGPLPIDMSFKESLYLGISTPPFLTSVKNKMFDFVIETPRYVVSGDYFRRERVRINDGPILHWRMLSGHFGKTLGQIGVDPGSFGTSEYLNYRDKPVLEVEAGDNVVTEWFIEHAYFDKMPIYERMQLARLKKTGEKVNLQRSIRESHFDATLLYGYQKMRRALGLLPAILPINIQEMVDSKLEIRRLQILNLLESLYRQEQRTSLRDKFREAVDFEMDINDWVVRRNEFPGGTMEINVPEFMMSVQQMVGA